VPITHSGVPEPAAAGPREPGGASLRWPGTIRPHAVPGLATCLQEHRLCRDGVPIPVSRLDVEALSLAEWTVARGRALVLCPADPLAPIAELIAGAVHVADMSTHYAATGIPTGSSRRVAVVTSDFHARGLYRSLGVRDPRGRGLASLRDAVPAATVGRDGIVRVLGRDSGHGWATVFAGSVSDLVTMHGIDLVVVELATPGAEAVLDLGIPAVVVARDPADYRLLRLAERALVVGWGSADLDRIKDDSGLPPRLAARATGATCELVPVASQGVCENAALFWHDVGALVRSGRGSSLTNELSRLAFGLFHDLIGLALPLAAFEAITEPVRARLAAIASAARLTHGDTKDLYLPMVEVELRDLASAVGEFPPKSDALIQTLGRLLDDHRDVMLVARTAALARLYTSRLSEDRTLRRIRVTSLGAIQGEAPAEVAVLTGMAPSWARWVYRCGVARRVVILAYVPDGQLESIANGFNEADMLRRLLADQSAREAWFARPSARDRVWSELSGEPRRVPDDDGISPPMNQLAESPFLQSPVEVPPGLWDGTGWFAPLESGATGAGMSTDPATSEAASTPATVNAVKVIFDGGTWALLDAAGVVTRFRAGSGTAQPAYPVSGLAGGDQVLFFDGDSRKDLLAKVIEVAEEVPELAVAGAWLSHWRRVLATAYQRFGSYAEFTLALAREGCSVQTQTVRLWVIGKTIGPDDEDDVRRVAVVTKDESLLAAHREVCRAIRSLRGAHVRLGQRLSDMARRVGPAVAAGRIASDEVVDERSGLTAADFLDSIDLLTVSSIEPAGIVPYVIVGRLNEAERSDSND
jgi:hypothetical protein